MLAQKYCILGRVKIFDNVKVAACSLILKSVPRTLRLLVYINRVINK